MARPRKSIGTEASAHTTVWQPLPEGPVITFPVGTTNIPVHNVTNFEVGQKIAIGYGTSGPAVARARLDERPIASRVAAPNLKQQRQRTCFARLTGNLGRPFRLFCSFPGDGSLPEIALGRITDARRLLA